MQETAFVERVRAAGGKVYVVGGWVRDRLRGISPKDKDYVVVGLTAEAFIALFSEAKMRRNFVSDFSFADRKNGSRNCLSPAGRETGDGVSGVRGKSRFINVSIDIFFIFSVGSGSATKSLFPLFLTTVT